MLKLFNKWHNSLERQPPYGIVNEVIVSTIQHRFKDFSVLVMKALEQ
jgi:hypothetical protein